MSESYMRTWTEGEIAFLQLDRPRANAIAELQRLNEGQNDPMMGGWISPDAAAASGAILDKG